MESHQLGPADSSFHLPPHNTFNFHTYRTPPSILSDTDESSSIEMHRPQPYGNRQGGGGGGRRPYQQPQSGNASWGQQRNGRQGSSPPPVLKAVSPPVPQRVPGPAPSATPRRSPQAPNNSYYRRQGHPQNNENTYGYNQTRAYGSPRNQSSSGSPPDSITNTSSSSERRYTPHTPMVHGHGQHWVLNQELKVRVSGIPKRYGTLAVYKALSNHGYIVRVEVVPASYDSVAYVIFRYDPPMCQEHHRTNIVSDHPQLRGLGLIVFTSKVRK
jgi:hypothetical protein